MTTGIVLGLVLFASVWLLRWELNFRFANFKRYKFHAEKFYAAIRPLMQDDETPAEILELVGFLNDRINDKRAMYSFMKFMIMGKLMGRSRAGEAKRPVIHDFLIKRPELKEPYQNALSHAMLAISFRSPFHWGALFRLWFTTAIAPQPEPSEAAENVSEGVIFKMLNGDAPKESRLAA